MHKPLGRNTVVLLGVGHTNAHVLRMWKMQPLANAQLICVSNFPVATYSGMLPGVLAGQYPPENMEIDLVRFCTSAGTRLIVDDVVGLDHEHRRLEFANRPPLFFDILSIGTGSCPTFEGVEVESERGLVAIKPMQTFLSRLKVALTSRSTERSEATPKRIVIVGGGVGSVEIAFCLNRRLQLSPAGFGQEILGKSGYEITLVTADDRLGGRLLESTQQKIREQLNSQKINLLTGQRVQKITAAGLVMHDGSTCDADAIVWATGAAPTPLLAKLGLATNEAGFLSTHPTLQTLTNEHIFAAGDAATIVGSETPKAGVYAVRQGPVLWNNIQRMLWHPPLEKYEPQSGFLKLINTGDDKAIAEYKGFSFHARWAWRLKDRIDSKFMAMYQDYEPMQMMIHDEDASAEMRCLGCGGKIGSELLGHVLQDLTIPPHEDVIIGLDRPDDAAVIKTHDNRVAVTTDFFASPFDDPYLVGRIALLNSASDCFVMGAQPTAALTMVELPLGHPRTQLRMMRELMGGSVEELAKMNATLVGGHSIEGPRLTIGFTVLGRQLSDPKTKGMLQAGDQLVLTKPLGSGVLLSALMKCQLPGNNYRPLLDAMLLSNIVALRLILEQRVSGITDVTGFGLAGHLAEMLQASHCSAEIKMDHVPLLPGVQDLIDAGVESTLASDNRLVSQKVELRMDDQKAARCASLFDPQTSGGLLFGVVEDSAEQVLQFLRNEGFGDSAIIGQVTNCNLEKPVLSIV